MKSLLRNLILAAVLALSLQAAAAPPFSRDLDPDKIWPADMSSDPAPPDAQAQQFYTSAMAWLWVIKALGEAAAPIAVGVIVWVLAEIKALKKAHADSSDDIATLQDQVAIGATRIVSSDVHVLPTPKAAPPAVTTPPASTVVAPLLIVAAAGSLLFFSSCGTMTPAQQTSLFTLGQTAVSALLSAAPSAASAASAGNFAAGATVGLRSLEGALVTPATVQQVVASFAPPSGTLQWAQLALTLANDYAAANPKTPAAASAALEAIANGIDAATAQTSP